MRTNVRVIRSMHIAIMGALALLVSPAAGHGQTQGQTQGQAQGQAPGQEGARAIFEAARDALADADALRVRVVVSGSGSLGTSIMPAGEATVEMVRADAPFRGSAMAVKIAGAGTDSPRDAEAERIGVSYLPDETRWLDIPQKALRIADTPRFEVDAQPVVTSLLSMPEFTAERPLARELAATAYEFGDPEQVGGVMCDVITVTYAEADPNDPDAQNHGAVLGTAGEAVWYIAQTDRLPRRIEAVQNAENLLILRYVRELRDIEVNPSGLTLDRLSTDAPDGFRTARRNTRPARAADDESRQDEELESAEGGLPGRRTQRETRRPVNPRRAAATDDRPKAPAFELETASGEPVTLESIQGEVSLLYFWGTWCVPCRTITPLVSDLVGTFEDQPVNVYGVAIRERTAEAPLEYMQSRGYKHTLLLHPGNPGGTQVARAFQVRRYPTLVVVGPDGAVAHASFPSPDVSEEELIAGVERAIRGELAKVTQAGG